MPDKIIIRDASGNVKKPGRFLEARDAFTFAPANPSAPTARLPLSRAVVPFLLHLVLIGISIPLEVGIGANKPLFSSGGIS